MTSTPNLVSAGLITLLLAPTALAQPVPPKPTPPPTPKPRPTPVTAPSIILRANDGKPLLTLKGRSDGYTVKDAQGARRFRIKLDARHAKVRDAKGKAIAHLSRSGAKWKVKTPGTKTTTFKLQARPAGGFKLETAADVTVARIVSDKQGGLQVTGKDGKELGAVKRGLKGRWVIRGPGKTVRYRVKGTTIRPLALACLLLPNLSQAERLGLLALVHRTARKPKPQKPTSRPTSKPSK